MGIRVCVSEHVIMAGDSIFAETAESVFELRTTGEHPRKMLDIGNRVRHYRQINLTEWLCYDKQRDRLPALYLEAAI